MYPSHPFPHTLLFKYHSISEVQTYFYRAILICINDPQVLKKATLLGDHIRSEDGVWTAVNAFHKYLDKAKLPQRLAKADPQ
jgi:hypothetical protein